MKIMRATALLSISLSVIGMSACSSSDPNEAAMNEAIASLEEKIPTRERASVRVCEFLFSPDTQLNTPELALNFVSGSLGELQNSTDPKGMRNALELALVGLGDATVAGDQTAYQAAAFNVAEVCTDIVSGEYGK